MEQYEPDPIFGDPATDFRLNPGQQEHSDTCAIRSQQLIIKEFTGHDPGENALVEKAEANHWYSPGSGTQPEHVGELLELYGIHCHQANNASVFHLADELAQGHKVIVGVASSELWDKTSDCLDPNHFSPADHAIVVSGIDTSDPVHPHVLVTDPGTGKAASYPMDQFIHAWHGSDFFYVATDEPAPETAPGMENFDYNQGHVNHALGVSYHDLHAIATDHVDWGGMEALSHYFQANGLGWVNEAFHQLMAHHEHAHPPEAHGHDGSHPAQIEVHDVYGHDYSHGHDHHHDHDIGHDADSDDDTTDDDPGDVTHF